MQYLQVSKEKSGEISIYQGQLTPKVVGRQTSRLMLAFPQLSAEYFSILGERLAANGFSDERLIDAVNRVIDTIPYKHLSIADIISYDVKVKLYSHNEVCQELDNGLTFADFVSITRSGKKYWVKKSDKLMYNIPDEL